MNPKNPEHPDELQLFTIQQDIFNVPAELIPNLHALVISDFHFNQKNNFYMSSPGRGKKRIDGVKSKKMKTMSALGDNVEQNQVPEAQQCFVKVVKLFQDIGLPTFIIGGNHDRQFVSSMKAGLPIPKKSVEIVSESCMVLNHPNPEPGKYPSVFFGHDLLNNFYSSVSETAPFLKALKRRVSIIPPEAFLLVGHVHSTKRIPEENVACVGSFSSEAAGFSRYEYAIITSDNGFTIEFGHC